MQMSLCDLLLLTLVVVMLNMLIPLWLTYENIPTWQVGMVGLSYPIGSLADTLPAG